MRVLNRKQKAIFFPIRAKLMVLFCLLITIPFVVIGAITYKKYLTGVERNTEELSYQVVGQITANLERYVKEMERLTIMPLYDDEVMAILRGHREQGQAVSYLTTEETNKMNLFLSSLAFDRTEIESMLIFTNDGNVFSNRDQSVARKWMESDSAWLTAVREKDGGLAILPPHEARYYTESGRQVVSIARMIREPYTNKPLGVVKVDLPPDGLGTVLPPVSFGESSQLYIRNAKQQEIYSSAPSESVPDASSIRASAASDYTGLQVTAYIPRDGLREEARELIRYTLIVSLIALLAAYAAAVIASKRLVGPIAHLQSKMRQVKRGLFEERAVATTNDEIGQLTEGFNTMIGEIERLVKEVYETKLREREAELSALQSQIHPHFLYNTLEMMNMLSLQGSRQQLSGIVTSLGKLLRYTVDKQERFVKLADEVKFVEAYLQIQEMRLGDKLQASIHIDSAYDYCQVPKLMLQPLVENVVEHAMIPGRTVHMMLTATVMDDDFVISVMDDGDGIPQDRQQWLQQQFGQSAADGSEASKEVLVRSGGERSYWSVRVSEGAAQGGFGSIQKGFALRNVHQRLRLLYGEPYGLSVGTRSEGGTVFHIRLPMQWGE